STRPWPCTSCAVPACGRGILPPPRPVRCAASRHACPWSLWAPPTLRPDRALEHREWALRPLADRTSLSLPAHRLPDPSLPDLERCERLDVLHLTHSDEGLISLYSFGPIAAVISLLSAVLTAFTSVLAPFAGESAAGIAVVLLTVCVRVLLVPVGVLQVRAEKARARIAPRLAEIGARYGKNPEKLVAEQRKVYAEAGTSPLAGCLPALAQMPVVMALYGMFIGAGGDAG